MKKWTLIRMVAVVAAVALIVFGGIDNFWRTAKLAWERFLERS